MLLGLLLVFSFSTYGIETEGDVFVKKLIDETVVDISKDAAKTFSQINKGVAPYKVGENYVFVYDINLNMVAHYDKALVGANLKGKTDVCGCYFRDEIYNRAMNSFGQETNCKTSDKEFVFYVYKNPKTGKLEHKKAFFKLAKGSDGKKYIVVSGSYSKELRECEK